jgi:hypothetical protein
VSTKVPASSLNVVDSDGSHAPLSLASKQTRACRKYVVDAFDGAAPEGGTKLVPATTPRTVERGAIEPVAGARRIKDAAARAPLGRMSMNVERMT